LPLVQLRRAVTLSVLDSSFRVVRVVGLVSTLHAIPEVAGVEELSVDDQTQEIFQGHVLSASPDHILSVLVSKHAHVNWERSNRCARNRPTLFIHLVKEDLELVMAPELCCACQVTTRKHRKQLSK